MNLLPYIRQLAEEQKGSFPPYPTEVELYLRVRGKLTVDELRNALKRLEEEGKVRVRPTVNSRLIELV